MNNIYKKKIDFETKLPQLIEAVLEFTNLCKDYFVLLLEEF